MVNDFASLKERLDDALNTDSVMSGHELMKFKDEIQLDCNGFEGTLRIMGAKWRDENSFKQAKTRLIACIKAEQRLYVDVMCNLHQIESKIIKFYAILLTDGDKKGKILKGKCSENIDNDFPHSSLPINFKNLTDWHYAFFKFILVYYSKCIISRQTKEQIQLFCNRYEQHFPDTFNGNQNSQQQT